MEETERVNKLVENAPKQVALKQGWLTKRAVTGVVKNWKKRYFVLLTDELCWYETADVNPQTGDSFIRGQCLGKLPVNADTILKPDTDTADKTNVFTLVSGDKQLVLQAADAASREAWVGVLLGMVKENIVEEPPPSLLKSLTSCEIIEEPEDEGAAEADEGAEDVQLPPARVKSEQVGATGSDAGVLLPSKAKSDGGLKSGGFDAEAAAAAPKQEAYYQGWLTKRAVSGLIKNWRGRYFVLLTDELRWYETAEVDPQTGDSFIKGSRLGGLAVDESTTLLMDIEFADRPFTFTLVSGEKQLVLQAPDADQKDAWIASLAARIQGLPPPPLKKPSDEPPPETSSPLARLTTGDPDDTDGGSAPVQLRRLTSCEIVETPFDPAAANDDGAEVAEELSISALATAREKMAALTVDLLKTDRSSLVSHRF